MTSPNTPKVSAEESPGLQDDHDPSDIGQKQANNTDDAKAHEEEDIRAFPDRDPVEKNTGEF